MKDYDLVVIGYQIWFLSPSLPILSVVNDPCFKNLVKDKKVVGIVTARNMWISGVRIINKRLKELGVESIKNIVLCDTSPAWATFVTTPRWMLTGKKEAFSFFPEAGVARDEFKRAKNFATLLLQNASNEALINCSHHQTRANIIMEKIGRPFFELWASIIYTLTKKDGFYRDLLLIFFRINLVFLILILLPVISVYAIVRGEKSSKLMTNFLSPK